MIDESREPSFSSDGAMVPRGAFTPYTQNNALRKMNTMLTADMENPGNRYKRDEAMDTAAALLAGGNDTGAGPGSTNIGERNRTNEGSSRRMSFRGTGGGVLGGVRFGHMGKNAAVDAALPQGARQMQQWIVQPTAGPNAIGSVCEDAGERGEADGVAKVPC